MKRVLSLLVLVGLFASPVLATGLISPGDFVLGIDDDGFTNYPAGEAPMYAIDGDAGTKYLNFGKQYTGLIVAPSNSAIAKGIEIVTANDATERDPASWILYGLTGFTDYGFTSIWEEIDSDAFALPDGRMISSGIIGINNDTAYEVYKIVFPELKDNGAANSMQIAEFQLHDVPEPATMALLGLGGLLLRRRK
jgi:hypothetical protein